MRKAILVLGGTALLPCVAFAGIVESQQLSIQELWSWMGLGVLVLVFGTIYLVLFTRALRHANSPDQVLRALGIILIIIAAVFLVVISTTSEQIAPVMGLLGTIAGYLLGRNSDSSHHRDKSETTQTAA